MHGFGPLNWLAGRKVSDLVQETLLQVITCSPFFLHWNRKSMVLYRRWSRSLGKDWRSSWTSLQSTSRSPSAQVDCHAMSYIFLLCWQQIKIQNASAANYISTVETMTWSSKDQHDKNSPDLYLGLISWEPGLNLLLCRQWRRSHQAWSPSVFLSTELSSWSL